MSLVFISHSSADATSASELSSWLKGRGYGSVFLDFDPADGVPAGRDWEKELYARLKAARAVVLLCSEHSMNSKWCFLEIGQARSLGKAIFPLKISECSIFPVLGDIQAIDMQAEGGLALERLDRGLRTAGLRKGTWDRTRPLYPGMLAFQEEDEAVFFGREDDVRDALDLFMRLLRFGGAPFVLVHGASGSGKSSLVRAGIVPQLRRSHEWLVVPPFRPLERPLEELTGALAAAFERYGERRPAEELLIALRERGREGSMCPRAFVNLARELRTVAKKPDGTVLIVIDQFEELLGYSAKHDAARFLPMIREALENSERRLIVVATLRSDFLGIFQQHPVLRRMPFESLAVGAMSMDEFAEVVQGPASVAGLQLEDGLVEKMTQDTMTEDALPLLAFTLRELYERHWGAELLTVDDYERDLGGLQASVGKAAEAVIMAYEQEGRSVDKRCIAKEEWNDVRRAFLTMVRMNEDGGYARRPASWSDLPPSTYDLLERFVQARLLISRGSEGSNNQIERTLEVSHEALYRKWDRLTSWLVDEMQFLRWRTRMDNHCKTWQETKKIRRALLHGPTVEDARRWMKTHRSLLDQRTREFLEASVREANRQRMVLLGSVGVLVVLFIFAGLFVFQAKRQADMADMARDMADMARREAQMQKNRAEEQALQAKAAEAKARAARDAPKAVDTRR